MVVDVVGAAAGGLRRGDRSFGATACACRCSLCGSTTGPGRGALIALQDAPNLAVDRVFVVSGAIGGGDDFPVQNFFRDLLTQALTMP